MKKIILTALLFTTNLAAQTTELKPQIPDVDSNTLNKLARSGELNAYAQLVRAEAEYKRAVVEEMLVASRHILAMSEARLKDEQSAYIRQARIIVEYEFGRIKEADSWNEHLSRNLEHTINLVKPLKKGIVTKDVMLGLETLLDETIPTAVVKKSLFRKVGPLGKDNFTPSTKDFPGGTVGDLLSFVKDNDLSFAKYHTGHEEILTFLMELAEPAEARLEKYRVATERIRTKGAPIPALPNNR